MFTLPKLDYSYDALEPYIDARTMEIHHSKHHQGYTDKLNAALEKYPKYFDMAAEDIIKNLSDVPEDIRKTVQNNGGGYVNHNFFWKIMAPKQESLMSSELARAVDKNFGGLKEFKDKFMEVAATQFGSGWGWLVVSDGKLEIMSTANQDSPLTVGKTPILGVDVWEHAYYLKHQNKRADYLNNFWSVVNWEQVSENFEEAR